MSVLKLSAEQQQEFSRQRLLLIDVDTLIYMIGWHHRDHQDTMTGLVALERWLKDFLLIYQAEAYLLCMGPDSPDYFRNRVYRYQPYKGKRAEKADWIRFWEPVFRSYMKDTFRSVVAPSQLEADDVLALLHEMFPEAIVCSGDKDMLQLKGFHINYKEKDIAPVTYVDEVTAAYNWGMLMLCGDSVDNIAGVPGIGEKKARELLRQYDEPYLMINSVALAYQKYFGNFYGPIIFEETSDTVTLVNSKHRLYNSLHLPEIDINGRILYHTV